MRTLALSNLGIQVFVTTIVSNDLVQRENILREGRGGESRLRREMTVFRESEWWGLVYLITPREGGGTLFCVSAVSQKHRGVMRFLGKLWPEVARDWLEQQISHLMG